MDEAAGAEEQYYNVRGYGYTGGGRKITRAEVSLDSGATWLLAEIDRPEKPTKYGKYWCWMFWSLKLDARRLAKAQEVCCRIWDESNNTQPAFITWNVMGMGNNCFFRVRVHRREAAAACSACLPENLATPTSRVAERLGEQTSPVAAARSLPPLLTRRCLRLRSTPARRMESEGSKVKLQFEHPTVPGPSPGGWMGNQAGGWKARSSSCCRHLAPPLRCCEQPKALATNSVRPAAY